MTLLHKDHFIFSINTKTQDTSKPGVQNKKPSSPKVHYINSECLRWIILYTGLHCASCTSGFKAEMTTFNKMPLPATALFKFGVIA